MRSSRLHTGEDGLTLVEVVVTVAIMGIAFVSLIGGMWTAIVTSDTHRKQAVATTHLISAAEYLKAETSVPYAECGTYSPNDVPDTVVPADWKADMAVTVQYWTIDATGVGSFSSDVADCLATVSSYDLQRVTVTAESPDDARATESLTFVKRPE